VGRGATRRRRSEVRDEDEDRLRRWAAHDQPRCAGHGRLPRQQHDGRRERPRRRDRPAGHADPARGSGHPSRHRRWWRCRRVLRHARQPRRSVRRGRVLRALDLPGRGLARDRERPPLGRHARPHLPRALLARRPVPGRLRPERERPVQRLLDLPPDGHGRVGQRDGRVLPELHAGPRRSRRLQRRLRLRPREPRVRDPVRGRRRRRQLPVLVRGPRHGPDDARDDRGRGHLVPVDLQRDDGPLRGGWSRGCDGRRRLHG
jgi:hypothetical protein